MPSETDPLLPWGKTAPEISGHGFSKPSDSQYQIQNQGFDYDSSADVEDKREPQRRLSYGDIPPLRTILVIFVLVVGLAMFVSLLMPGAFAIPWNREPKDDVLTVKARVGKILSETPLIGPLALYLCQYLGTSSNSTIRWP